MMRLWRSKIELGTGRPNQARHPGEVALAYSAGGSFQFRLGVYEMEYTVYDIFMRPMKLPRVEVTWDGEQLTVTGGGWEGQETLKQQNQ